jgi:hypothetical protein
VQYLEGKCLGHRQGHFVRLEGEYGYTQAYIEPKRKDCPDCMTEIKKELNIQ